MEVAHTGVKNQSTQQYSTMASTGEYIDLHELAKGWKAAISRCTDPATKHEAQIRNDRGNLPLHSATSFRAPIEVAGQ